MPFYALWRLALTVVLFTLVVGTTARAQPYIFGLEEYEITPESGMATWLDPILIEMSGVAGSSQTPQHWNLSPTGENELTINLVNTSPIGLTVLTPWQFDVELPPLAAGRYDIYTRDFIPGLIGEPQLLVSDFVVTGPFPGLPGDFNRDNRVDAGDYEHWREHFAEGTMTAADYVRWRNNVGAAVPESSTSRGAVPEPSATALLMLCSIAAVCALGRSLQPPGGWVSPC